MTSLAAILSVAFSSAPASDTKMLASASQLPSLPGGSGFPDVFSGLIHTDVNEPQKSKDPEEQSNANVARGELTSTFAASLAPQTAPNVPSSFFGFQLNFVRPQDPIPASGSQATDVGSSTTSTDEATSQQTRTVLSLARKDATQFSDAAPEGSPTTQSQSPVLTLPLNLPVSAGAAIPERPSSGQSQVPAAPLSGGQTTSFAEVTNQSTLVAGVPPQDETILPASQLQSRAATTLSDATPETSSAAQGQTPPPPIRLDFRVSNEAEAPARLGPGESHPPVARLSCGQTPSSTRVANQSASAAGFQIQNATIARGSQLQNRETGFETPALPTAAPAQPIEQAVKDVQITAAPRSEAASLPTIPSLPRALRRQVEATVVRQSDPGPKESVNGRTEPILSALPILALPSVAPDSSSVTQSTSAPVALQAPPVIRDSSPSSTPQSPNADPMASSPRPESTPWKQSAERLQSAELAFAVRVADPQVQVATARESTLATEPETKPHSSDSAAAAAHSFAAPGPGTSVMPVTQTRDDARDNGSAAPSKTETASVSQSPETPTGSKKVDTGDPAPDTREAPVAKMQRPSLETTLASVPPVANSPARETEKVHQPQPAPEVHSLPDEPQAPTSQPVRDLSLRLSTPGQDKVEVKVVESAGEIRVAVRSTDPQLTSSLQEGISELTGRLESRGLQAETWRPSENSTPSSVTHSQSSSNNQQTFSDDGSQRRRGQQEQVLPSRRRNKPDWLREIDGTSNTLHNDITRRTS